MIMIIIITIIIIKIITQLRDHLIYVIRCTERVAVFLNCIRQSLGSNLTGAPTILTGVCYSIPQCLQTNPKTVPQIRPRKLRST